MFVETAEWFVKWAGAFGGLSVYIFGYIQLHLARKKRTDDLFVTRYNFYKRIRSYWESTTYLVRADEHILNEFAEEAYFLFHEDIYDHIRSLKGKCFVQDKRFPNNSFTGPFISYLKIIQKEH